MSERVRALWQCGLRRVEALSLRERLILAGAAPVLVWALLDLTWIQPLAAETARLSAQVQEASGRLATLEAELLRLQPVHKPASPAADPRRQELERLRAELGQAASLDGLQSLRRALTLTLTPSSGVDVHALTLLPAEPEQAGGPLHRQGMEIALSGPYPRLVAALRTLEASAPGLVWGPLELSVPRPGTVLLKARVYAYGDDQPWVWL